MSEVRIRPAKRLYGTLRVPGDKSLSHRALILAALADGASRLHGLLAGADIFSTARILEALGVRMTPFMNQDDGARGSFGMLAENSIDDFHRVVVDAHASVWSAVVEGRGFHGLMEPRHVLDAGNSGTTARLMLGLLAAQPFFAVLSGDDSLIRRPMRRVVDPLSRMGARFDGREGGDRLPIAVRGGRLTPIDYRLPVASAQVKSALILAALYAEGESRIIEPGRSRDHTERLLAQFGHPLTIRSAATGEDPAAERTIVVRPAVRLSPQTLHIPGDFSSAAFFLALGAAHPEAEITLCGVGVNPTRTGMLDVLQAMGADVEMRFQEADAVESAYRVQAAEGEPIADLIVRTSRLTATEIGGTLIPRLIDELPVIAVLATQAEGTTVIRDAEELKVKESDRIGAVVERLQAMGARIRATSDGMIVEGPTPLRPARLDSAGDHRLAMAFAVAALLAEGGPDAETVIEGSEAADISYPTFYDDLVCLGAEVGKGNR